MSNYHGRRSANVSHLLQDLNNFNDTEDNFNIDDNLELFTNTQFIDYDSGQQTDFQAQPTKAAAALDTRMKANATAANGEDPHSAATSTIGEMPNLDLVMNSDFNFDFTNPYPAFTEGPQNFHPMQPGHGSVYGTPAATSPNQQFPQGAATPADSRKATSPNAGRPLNLEEASRHAADEDKRRRNTAASARFRVKKKQREQALEKSAKEMSDKVSSLESKVSQLETENKWLKNLLVDKDGKDNDISVMWNDFTKHVSEKKAAEAAASSR